MRIFFITLLLLKACFVFARDKDHLDPPDTLGVGLTIYPFFYDAQFKYGSTAIGPTVVMNDDRIILQLSAFFDLRQYTVIELSHFGGNEHKEKGFFLSLFAGYKYYRFSSKVYCFAMGGECSARGAIVIPIMIKELATLFLGFLAQVFHFNLQTELN